jgi:hypothetical protein
VVAILVACAPAMAQDVGEQVKQTCRSVSAQTARAIAAALRARVDPGAQVKKIANSWLEGVQAHMLLAASQAQHLTEEELATLGYSYCIERRPSDRR